MAAGTYININEYILYLRKTYKRNNNLKIGQMYSYQYLFNKAPNFDKQDPNKIKFYDFYPITFVFDIDFDNDTLFGLNFHHLPVKSRMMWLDRTKKISEIQFAKPGVNRIPALRYPQLKAMFRKSVFGIRQYKMERFRDLRIIPNEKWEEVFDFYSRTYYGVTLRAVANKYRTFIPR